MANLSDNRDPHLRDALNPTVPGLMGAVAEVFQGSIIVWDAGYMVPGKPGASLVTAGVSKENFKNPGAVAGVKQMAVTRELFEVDLSAVVGATITRAHVGKLVYVQDDHTISATTQTDTLSAQLFLVDLVRGGTKGLVRVP